MHENIISTILCPVFLLFLFYWLCIIFQCAGPMISSFNIFLIIACISFLRATFLLHAIKTFLSYVQLILPLDHWGQVTHICVSNLTTIGSDNGLSPARRQAIIWTNAGILFIGPLGTNFSEILITTGIFSFKKMHLKFAVRKLAAIWSRPQLINRARPASTSEWPLWHFSCWHDMSDIRESIRTHLSLNVYFVILNRSTSAKNDSQIKLLAHRHMFAVRHDKLKCGFIYFDDVILASQLCFTLNSGMIRKHK